MKSLKRKIQTSLLAVSMAVAATTMSAPTRAEVTDLKLATQYSLAHLPLMVMQYQDFLRNRLDEQGLEKTDITWMSLAGSSAMIDGILSGSLHISSTGTTGFGILWDRTKGNVKALAAQGSMPVVLVTREPDVTSIEELPEGSRIALPAVGTSPQAIFLKIAAFQRYGKEGVNRFDKMTVTMAHPDAYAAMLTGASGVNAHFTLAPFSDWELERIPGSSVILNSDEVTGGPSSTTVIIATEDFRKKNPKTFEAVSKAARDAIDFINAEPEAAAKIYLQALRNEKESVSDVVRQMTDPSVTFDYAPSNMVSLFEGMHQVDVIKRTPGDWKELFFPEAHDLNGS